MTTQFPNGKCFFFSCHASLEHDIGDLLRELGITIVKANNDREHTERPCIPGFTDKDYGDELRARVNTMSCRPEDFDGTNFIFMMNTDDLQHRVAYMAKFKPVIVYVFGQHMPLQLDELAGKINNQIDKGITPNIFVVCYARREYEYLKPRFYTELHRRLFYIRFAKRLEHYSLNLERLPFAFTASNSIQNRGDGCGWPQLRELRTKIPHILAGHETEQVGGTGRISFDDLRKLFATCGVYLSFPAWPAPLVMNLFESGLAGCPVAFYDNGQGAADEGLFNDGVGCLSSDTSVLLDYCRRCLKDRDFRGEQSVKVQQRFTEFYEFNRQIPQWQALFSDMSQLW